MNKILHLGRNLGAKYLELLEAEASEINTMGQWSEGMQQKCYSAKLPMGPIRKLAGFSGKTKIYFNTRTVVEPPKELLLTTPLGKWVYGACEAVTEASDAGQCMTAICTLRFFVQLNKIFLQDAAAMQVLFPERADHALFNEMPCFQSDLFEVRSEFASASERFQRFIIGRRSLSNYFLVITVVQSDNENGSAGREMPRVYCPECISGTKQITKQLSVWWIG
jgi:hypothetical protein